MKISWPPAPIGLGTPLNLAYLSSETFAAFKRSWWMIPIAGITTPLLMLAIDHIFFEGSSLQRVLALGSEPLGFRVLVVFYSGITEELFYRLLLSTLIAWLAHLALSSYIRNAKPISQWLGTVIAALIFGLAHVGNLPNVVNPILRAISVNGVAGLIFGWLYWWYGLEMAILTHVLAIVVLYIAIPPFL